ncbi:DnaB-like helicase C-terminal domain-containing protein [Botrimarina sp.]|uniref:DnaB-like helicase C-terminal domain-containing protein n=1 Tax=Botrimarina sp. TaxID=2795802 RepID=UPI0032EDEE25
MSTNYDTAGDLLAGWRDDLLTGERPPRWAVGGAVFDPVELGPGLVMLLGGAPGAGKTALAMQWTLDALRLSPALRALVVNVETSPAVLLDRQLSRLSGIPLATVRDRELGELHGDRLAFGFDAIEAVADRLAFLAPPFDLPSIATAADGFGADLLVLDYAQRIDTGDRGDKRAGVNVLMDYLRRFAGAGVGVLALAAVGRTKDAKGRSSYAAEGLSLASFRESSELEFGCDSAYMLSRGGRPDEADLRCLKNRHGEPRDLRLTFDGALQRFESLDDFAEFAGGGPVEALAELWNADGEGAA